MDESMELLKEIIEQIKAGYRRGKCKRDFNRLNKTQQNYMKDLGIDPDSLIKREEL